MGYSTPADVRSAVSPDLADPAQPSTDQTAARLDDTKLDDAIAQADSRIDSYISRYYVTPVPGDGGSPEVFPDAVRFLSRDLAAYFATLTVRKSQDLTPNDPVARRYADAMALLTGVRDGKATLDIPTPTQDGDVQAGVGQPINQEAVMFNQGDFGLETTGGFRRPWWWQGPLP